MQVPIVKLSKASHTAAKAIINASKNKTTHSQQLIMADYFCFLQSKNKSDKLNFPKMLLSK